MLLVVVCGVVRFVHESFVHGSFAHQSFVHQSFVHQSLFMRGLALLLSTSTTTPVSLHHWGQVTVKFTGDEITKKVPKSRLRDKKKVLFLSISLSLKKLSISLSLYLSIYLSISLSLYLPISLSLGLWQRRAGCSWPLQARQEERQTKTKTTKGEPEGTRNPMGAN